MSDTYTETTSKDWEPTKSDTYTETTSKGWTTRIGESFKGIVSGLVLIGLSCFLLFWNEGRAVQTAKSLAEGAALVISIDAAKVDPANEGNLVHVTGGIKASINPNDAEFGISPTGLRLFRTAEMYQWVERKKEETRKHAGGSEETVTTYSYVQEWSTAQINSRDFKVPEGHLNPAMRYRSAKFNGDDVTLGAFRPGDHIVDRLSASQQVRVDAAMAEVLGTRVSGPVHVNDGMFYLGANPTQPRIGDIRISYQLVPAGPVSIVGRQSGSDLTHYHTHAGDLLLMVQTGTISAADMFAEAKTANTVTTWILRVVGALLMFVGFRMIFAPLVVVADVIPLIGDILSAGSSLVSFVATAVLAPLVIAIAWLWYRPLVSFIVIAAGVAAAFGLHMLRGSRKPAPPQPAPAPV